MSFKKRLIKNIFNENLLKWIVIFLLSQTNLYGGMYPFGLPAFAVLGSSPFHILAYALGVIMQREGLLSVMRRVIAISLYVSLGHLTRKIPDYARAGISALLAGMLSLLALNYGLFLQLYFVVGEALISAVFAFMLKRSNGAITGKRKPDSEIDFAFLIITILCIFLSFSDIDLGRLSLSSSLMLFFGMASAYKHKPSISVAVNMGAGFFTMLFTPENVASIAFLTISGFTASLLKMHGKFLIPVTYMAFFPLFLRFNINVTGYYLEDMVFSSLLFLAIPSRFMEYVDFIPGSDKKEVSFMRLSERINTLSETFYSISEVFSGIEMRTFKKEVSDASTLTVNEVCKMCYNKGRCSEETRKILKTLEGRKSFLSEDKINCNRKKELLATFSGNLRTLRMENVLENHISEENNAMANQMHCMARMLKDVCKAREFEIYRNEEAEREIVANLKRKGIRIKNLVAGRSENGVFKVIAELIPCRKNGFCDNIVKETIEDILGFEVIRYGMKNCSNCRVCYSEASVFKVESALAQVSAEEVSGDSSKFAYVDGEHFAVALSDGMGTGVKAKYKSDVATELTLRLLSAGMDLKNSLSMVNSLLLRQGGSDFTTLDLALINLETGEVEFTKNASASGYILRCGGSVKILKAEGSPIGIVGKTEIKIERCTLSEGDCLVMVSDGVSDCFEDDEEMASKIGEFTVGAASELADFIMAEAHKNRCSEIKDDMTVITVGCIKKQKSGKDKIKGGLVYEKRQKSNYIGQH